MLDDSMFVPLTDKDKKAALKRPASQDWEPVCPVPDDVTINVPYHKFGKPAASWSYYDAEGRLLYIICRFNLPDGKKQFFPLTYCQNRSGKRQWQWKGTKVPRPIYNLYGLASCPSAPVLICEGEKSADAAKVLFPDYVVTTSPNGAGSAAMADWSPLKGRSCIVWPDNDVAGTTHATEVAKLVLEAGAASVAVVTLPSDLPEKWDLADKLPDGLDLRDVLASAKPASPSPSLTLPPGFVMRKEGLFRKSDDPDKPDIYISGPFEILAETRDINGNAWGVLVRWYDHDGRQHDWTLPRGMLAGDGNDVRAQFLDGGLCVAPDRKAQNLLMHFLIAVRTSQRARSVDKVGWHGKTYVTPTQTYGDTSEERVLLQSASALPINSISGSVESWQEEIAKFAVNNSRLGLAISAAYAGPLLQLAGEDSFGFHFTGGSSSGKTTAVGVAGSVSGVPTNTWRTTDNGAEALARNSNDALLILDELSQADSRSAEAMAYMLGNGQGKGRMRKDMKTRPVSTWRTIFLSTGEIGLLEKLNEIGHKPRPGQAVRMIEIPADANRGHKAV